MERMVVLLSGGLNSVVAASRMMTNVELHFLHVDCGQAAAVAERQAAQRICAALAGTLHVAELPRFSGEGGAEGERADAREGAPESASSGAVRPAGAMLTVLGLGRQLALRVGAEDIICGASEVCARADVEAGFGVESAEARHAFFHACSIAFEMGSAMGRRLTLELPFMDASREDIIRTGLRLGAPLHMTWSCHVSGDGPCEKCGGCRSRAAAFEALGQIDPAMAGAGR